MLPLKLRGLKIKKNLNLRVRVNNQIKSSPVRVIDENGANVGVLEIDEALKIAQEKNLDLIEIAPTANPPVCKTMDLGKYHYEIEKKERLAAKKSHKIEMKNIRISLGISQHDLELKAKKASEFLEEGNKIRIELVLRGRAKYLDESFLKERVDRILRLIAAKFKIAEGHKKGPRGMTLTLEKA